MRSRPMLLPLLAAALVAACTAGGQTPSSAGSAQPAQDAQLASDSRLDGRAFVSTSVAGRDLVTGSRVTIMLKDGRLGVNAGCNSMSAAYQLDGGRLSMGVMATTEMACPDPLMAQDQWLAEFLPGAKLDLVDTTLTLAKGGVTVTLVDKKTTNLPLDGTTWTVDGLVSADAVSSLPSGVTATLVFGDGAVDVKTGCNSGHGSVTVGSDTITFDLLAITAMLCGDDAMRVETHVLSVLAGEQPYAIDGDSLTIGTRGVAGLILRGATGGTTAPSPGPSGA